MLEYLAQLGPIAIVCSAIGTCSFAWLAIDANQKINRRKAALDYFTRNIWDEDFIAARKTFVSELKKEGGLKNWANINHIGSPQLTAIDNIFQHYELMAIGIQNRAFDEAVCRQWCRGTLLQDWENSKSCIEEMRKISGNPKIYLEFETLAGQWSKA